MTPIGFISLFPVADLIILVALLSALSILLVLLMALWRDQSSGSWLTNTFPLHWIPRIRLRVRTPLVVIAILGLELGWEVVAWRSWPLRNTYLGQVGHYTGREADCAKRLQEIEKQLAAIDAGAPLWHENETSTAAARAADRDHYRDRLRRESSHLSARADVYRQLRRKYERAAADPLRPLPADPLLPEAPIEPIDWLGRGQYAQALAGFEEEIRSYGDYAWAFERRAWILATCPDTKLRNGKLAVAAATHAAELTKWKDENVLATLAASYAESGDFASAVRWQQRALERSAATGADAKWYEDRLTLYKAGKPYRLPDRHGIWNVRFR
jgi:hypothetical protein